MQFQKYETTAIFSIKAVRDSIYTLLPGEFINTLNIAISAIIVLPEPVGAPKRTL